MTVQGFLYWLSFCLVWGFVTTVDGLTVTILVIGNDKVEVESGNAN